MTTAVVAPDPVLNPISAWNYCNSRRKVVDAEAKERPLLRIWDKRMQYIGTVATERSLDAEQMLHETGTGQVVLRGSDWLINFIRTDVRAHEDLNLTVDPYPRWRNWRRRIGFKVTCIRVGRGEDGLKNVTLEISENREHWKHLLFGATPFMPPEAQPIKAWLTPGNTRTITFLAGFVNLARLFNPAMAIVGNVANPGAWVSVASLGNWNPLNWPLQMQFVNPVFDQSRLSILMSRWQNAHDVTATMLKDSGCHVRAYIWLEEDEDSPHPELAALIGETLARPTRNCIVLACEDGSGVTGPTGTALDGAINLIAATGDDLITETLIPEYDKNGDGVTDPVIRKWFGVAPAVPDLLFRDGDQSAIITSEHSIYKSKAKHIMTGGRSPGWAGAPSGNWGGTGPAGESNESIKFRHSSSSSGFRRSRRSSPKASFTMRARPPSDLGSKRSTRARPMTCCWPSCATPIRTVSLTLPTMDFSKSSCRVRARRGWSRRH